MQAATLSASLRRQATGGMFPSRPHPLRRPTMQRLPPTMLLPLPPPRRTMRQLLPPLATRLPLPPRTMRPPLQPRMLRRRQPSHLCRFVHPPRRVAMPLYPLQPPLMLVRIARRTLLRQMLSKHRTRLMSPVRRPVRPSQTRLLRSKRPARQLTLVARWMRHHLSLLRRRALRQSRRSRLEAFPATLLAAFRLGRLSLGASRSPLVVVARPSRPPRRWLLVHRLAPSLLAASAAVLPLQPLRPQAPRRGPI